MKRIWTIGAGIIALLIGLNAHAGIYIEPKIDYSGLALDASGIPAGGLKGVMTGIRLGYSVPAFVLALDYQSGSPEAEINNVTLDADVTRTGATLIFAPPVIPFNVLAGWYNAELKHNGTTYKGDGTKFGIMLTMLPFLNINLEYFKTNYDTSSLSDQGVMAGLSVDFDL